MNQLYFDNNIVSYLQNSTRHSDQPWYEDFIAIKDFLNKNGHIFSIVYSEAHLSDVSAGYLKNKRAAIRKLNFLGELTKGNFLQKTNVETEVKVVNRKPITLFRDFIQNDPFIFLATHQDARFSQLLEGISLLDGCKNIAIHPDIVSKIKDLELGFSRVAEDPTIYSLILDLIDSFQGLVTSVDIYKLFRDYSQRNLGISNRLLAQDNPLSIIEALFRETKVGSAISEQMWESFHDSQSTLEDKMASDYMNLDLAGYKSDKLKKNHSYLNVTTDAQHCFYGSFCDVYVTNDGKALWKTKAVYASHQRSTKVMGISEFSKWLYRS